MVVLDNVHKSSTRASGTDYNKSPYATNALNQLFQEGYDASSISSTGSSGVVGSSRIVVLLKAR